MARFDSETLKKRWENPEYRKHQIEFMIAKWKEPDYQKMMRERKGFTGRQHSENSKAKMSEIKKESYQGENHPWFGRKHTDETKKKISEANKGNHWSEEAKHKMSITRIGRHAGEKNPQYGKKKSEETLKKLSLSLKGHNAGAKHYRWNGLTPIMEQIRNCHEYREWRENVFACDDYTCSSCGAKGVYVEAHHTPRSFRDIIYDNNIKTVKDAVLCGELWDRKNGITLCRKCHDNTKIGYPKQTDNLNA